MPTVRWAMASTASHPVSDFSVQRIRGPSAGSRKLSSSSPERASSKRRQKKSKDSSGHDSLTLEELVGEPETARAVGA